MKIILQIALCLAGLFLAYLVLCAVFGLAVHFVLIGAALAALIGVTRWQYSRWQARRLPGKRAVKKMEKRTEKALSELERKVNKLQ